MHGSAKKRARLEMDIGRENANYHEIQSKFDERDAEKENIKLK